MTLLPLSYFFFFFFFFFSLPFSANSQLNDRSTLLNLKRQFGDPPALRLWNNTSSPCEWQMINCTAGNITGINFRNQNFTAAVPSTICDFPNLVSLDLLYNYFPGEFPTVLYNCTKLQYLDLSQNYFNGTLPDDIDRLSNELEYLDLAANSFSGDIPKNIGRISKLKVLNLYQSEYDGTFPSEIGDLSELEELRLAYNDKFSPAYIPTEFGKLKKLKYLWLKEMNLIGEIPAVLFENMTDLKHVDLSVNNLTGRIPEVLFGLKNLTDLYLYANDLTGEIPKSISATNMVELDLSANNLTGSIPVSIGNLAKLELLNLFNNELTGEIPESLGDCETLVTVQLQNNKIKGQVPRWLWKLPRFNNVNLSNNRFTSFERINDTSSARRKDMIYLFGANNNFTGKIPSFICEFNSLKILDLSNNKFNGSFPRCLGNFWGTLTALYLRKNRLSGSLPEIIFERLISLDVGHNQLVGKLPRSLIHFSALEILNVESNRINDTFPFWLSSLQQLQVLVLRSNAFHGPIRQTGFSKLRIIDISSNHLYGTLPSDCFVNWTAMCSLGKNEDRYMGTSYYSDSMVLMNKGIEMKLERILKIYTAIDFSGNRFQGEIPKSVGFLKELHVLNFSNNAFTDFLPSSMTNLRELESLDVSQNKLSGEIPQELGSLSYLSYMNFSHNQLVGLVPGGTQFKTQPCSSFKYNLGLYGPTLDEVCLDTHSKTQQSVTPKPEEDVNEVIISWVAAAIGFMPGITFGFTMGYILLSYKPESFMNQNKRRSFGK